MAGSVVLALTAAAEVPWQGGLAAGEVPGSCEVDAVHRDAVLAGQVPSSGGSPSAVGELSAWPASGPVGSRAGERISAAVEEVPSGEAEFDRTGGRHRG